LAYLAVKIFIECCGSTIELGALVGRVERRDAKRRAAH
jgi:hypothetical protein